jgi:hypothetical protein
VLGGNPRRAHAARSPTDDEQVDVVHSVASYLGAGHLQRLSVAVRGGSLTLSSIRTCLANVASP